VDYTWTITGLETLPKVNDLDNVVVIASWKVVGIADTLEAFECGATKLNNPDPSSFIDFNKLTEQDCLKFVKKELGESVIAQIELNVKQKIEKQKVKLPVSVPLPWIVE